LYGLLWRHWLARARQLLKKICLDPRLSIRVKSE
jgi:hypothetical protein